MSPIRVAVRGVSAEDIDEFKSALLPLEAKILRHDVEASCVFLTVPNEAAFAALHAVSGYAIERLESPREAGAGSRTTGLSSPESAAVSVAQHARKDQGCGRRKPLSSSDVFYLLLEPNLVAPLVCLLLVLHTLASLCFTVWSPPLVVALLPAAALLLLRALSPREGGSGSFEGSTGQGLPLETPRVSSQ